MDFEGFWAKCKLVADQLKNEERLTVVGHYDADGLSSTAITVKALRRAGVETNFVNMRQLSSTEVDEINAIETPVVFVDMGSGQIERIEKDIKNKWYIIDHHPPIKETDNQVNPFQHQIDGTRELSAAGTCYFVAKAMDPKNQDLAPVAIVGSVGDMQDLHGGLKGANRKILEDGKELGLVDFHKNLRLFGRQSRPLAKMLEYASDPILPGLTGNYMACVQFINGLGIPIKDPVGGEVIHYVDLDEEQRKKFTSALYMLLVDHHCPDLVCSMLIGEVYDFLKEKKKTELRDAKEFATVLNACGRHEEGEIGVEVLMGDRGEAWHKANALLEQHRRELREGIEWLKSEGMKTTDILHYFDATGVIRETIVGVIAGMAYGALLLDTKKPIIAFAETEEGEVKISGRGNYNLVKRGLKLGVGLNEACQQVGGEGGGHDVAAGAKISPDKKEEFLKLIEGIIEKQLG